MLAIDFPEVNNRPPIEVSDEAHLGIPSYHGPVILLDQEYTFPGIITCWKLSKEDMELIQETGCVWMLVEGNIMQSTSLTTENPFKNGAL